jgi:hypothetical protein
MSQIVRAIDDSGDWLFGKGKNDYVSFNDAVMQNIRTRLQSFLGDCYFANDQGLDWFNLLGQPKSNEIPTNLNVTTTILNTDNVTDLVQLSIVTGASRETKITYTVTTSFSGSTVRLVGGTTVHLTTEDGDLLITEDGDHLDA